MEIRLEETILYFGRYLNICRAPDYLSDLCTITVQRTWNSVSNIWT